MYPNHPNNPLLRPQLPIMTTPPQAQNNSSQTLTRNDPEILELTKDKKPKKAGWLQDEVELLFTLRENNPSMQWAALTELFNKEVTPDRHRSTDSLNSKHKALLKASQDAERLEEHVRPVIFSVCRLTVSRLSHKSRATSLCLLIMRSQLRGMPCRRWTKPMRGIPRS